MHTGSPLKSPRKGTCSNIWQAGALINCLLVGLYIDFNSKDNAKKVGLSFLEPSNQKLTRILNHSVDLEAKEIRDRFSITLRVLIQECLLRESTSRPSSIDLVKRTREGFKAALEAAKKTNAAASPMDNIPFVALEPAEPPVAWTVERFAGEWEVVIDTPNQTPPLTRGQSATSLWGAAAGLKNLGSMSSLSLNRLRSPPPKSQSGASTSSSRSRSMFSASNFESPFWTGISKSPRSRGTNTHVTTKAADDDFVWLGSPPDDPIAPNADLLSEEPIDVARDI